MLKSTPLILMILDGWGYSEKAAYNAIAAAHTPQWNSWWKTCPHTLLEASGTPVGLPTEQMGNSEVGHMHIGAGRIIMQDFTRINAAIEHDAYCKNPAFLEAIHTLKTHENTLHIMGLLSPGGVHSHEDHLFAFLNCCAEAGAGRIALHLFLDGRDTPPKSALTSLKALQAVIAQYPDSLLKPTICSLSGRYYAMDRDKRWERIEPVYQLLTERQSPMEFTTAEEALAFYYHQNVYDEFIPPTRIQCSSTVSPIINPGDSVFFFNFRADRARQLTEALISDTFTGFQRHVRPQISTFISMTEYADYLSTHIAFPPIPINNTLGEIIAVHGLRQLRIAETEKYAHVTFFFNGGSESVFNGEQRILIPSPPVATYDLQPEMNAPVVTSAIVEAIQQQAYDVIICNFANADMVGHTGDFDATVKAIECLDHCMQRIGDAVKDVGGQLLITADHGNAERMFDESTHQAYTAHTCQPVPLLYVGQGWDFNTKEGSLIDIAPTILHLLGITPPAEMTGKIILTRHSQKS